MTQVAPQPRADDPAACSLRSVESTMTERARALDLAKSTVVNLCTALEDSHMIRRVDGRRALDYKVLELGQGFLAGTDIVSEFRTATAALPVASQETLLLATLDDLDVVYLARHDGSQHVRLASDIGRRMAAVVTSLGKAMLASLPLEEIDRRLARVRKLLAFTPRSHRTMDALRATSRASASAVTPSTASRTPRASPASESPSPATGLPLSRSAPRCSPPGSPRTSTRPSWTTSTPSPAVWHVSPPPRRRTWNGESPGRGHPGGSLIRRSARRSCVAEPVGLGEEEVAAGGPGVGAVAQARPGQGVEVLWHGRVPPTAHDPRIRRMPSQRPLVVGPSGSLRPHPYAGMFD
ncbi:IclR family transcriptional regulator domain-containing protein [Streptomyces dysideae]|nr:hypothetical protein [Streptomyces dysideae]